MDIFELEKEVKIDRVVEELQKRKLYANLDLEYDDGEIIDAELEIKQAVKC